MRRGTVYLEMSMSLDGFITGPNVRVGNGMGDDGDRLHDWKFDAKTETDAAGNSGASVNDMTDPTLVDRLTGNAAFNALPGRVTAAGALSLGSGSPYGR